MSNPSKDREIKVPGLVDASNDPALGEYTNDESIPGVSDTSADLVRSILWEARLKAAQNMKDAMDNDDPKVWLPASKYVLDYFRKHGEQPPEKDWQDKLLDAIANSED